MGSKKKLKTSLSSTPLKDGFAKSDVDNLLKSFNSLAGANGDQSDIKQGRVADIDLTVKEQQARGFTEAQIGIDENIVKNVTTAIKRRQNNILLRRTQPGEAQTRLLQNVSRT